MCKTFIQRLLYSTLIGLLLPQLASAQPYATTVVPLEGEFEADSLLNEVITLLHDEQRLESMGKAMRTLAVPDACERIVNIILDVCR